MTADEIMACFQMSHIYNQFKDKEDVSLNDEFLRKYKELENQYFQHVREINGLEKNEPIAKAPVMIDGEEAFSCIASIINEVTPQIKNPELVECVNQSMLKIRDLVIKEKEQSK